MTTARTARMLEATTPRPFGQLGNLAADLTLFSHGIDAMERDLRAWRREIEEALQSGGNDDGR